MWLRPFLGGRRCAGLALAPALTACSVPTTSAPYTEPRPGLALPSSASRPASSSAVTQSSAAASSDDRAESLLRAMTRDEKLAYLGGDQSMFIRAVPRLGIPAIRMSDGPAGCRNWGPSTAYPVAVALAASFDPALVERVGRSIGRDCRARGVRILLAPGVNIARSPLNGRNFEYMGEDPYLAGVTAAAYIRGVQSEGVLATVKHFVANNQEWDRNRISSEVDERALREIYFPAFERAVREGHVGAVMSAYNPLNGTYCSQNSWLLRDVLRRQWGFSGIVMSDWGAVHDTLGAVEGGCDLEMPSGRFLNGAMLGPLLSSGRITPAAIDEKVRNVLRTIAAAGFLDGPGSRDAVPLDDPTSEATALEAARRGIVLLKNAGGLLPLDRTTTRRIALVGPNIEPAVVGGFGSGFVTPLHVVSLVDGMRQLAGAVRIDVHPGIRQPFEYEALGQPCFAGPVRQDVFDGEALAGEPASTSAVDRIDFRPEGSAPRGVHAGGYSIRWTGTLAIPKKGRYRLMVNADDGARVLVDGTMVVDDWGPHEAKLRDVTLDLGAGGHKLLFEYHQDTGRAVAQLGLAPADAHAPAAAMTGAAELAAVARNADVVVVGIGFGQAGATNSVRTPFTGRWPPSGTRASGLVEAEDDDRPFELPPSQIETVRVAMAANPHTIVVVNSGGAVDLQGIADRVPALIWAEYPGEDGGRAIAEVLFGDTNPSGKLPITFGRRLEDFPSSASYHVDNGGKTPYADGVFVGYRGFEHAHRAPMYAFGHGLGYSPFAYTDLQAWPTAEGGADVRLTVVNDGTRTGDEVVQIYVAPPEGIGGPERPPKELKGFARVSLAPGEAKRVSLTLEPRAFAVWDDRAKRWAVAAGAYEVVAAAASDDIRLRRSIDVAARTIDP